jgi:hypothetical protein
MRALSATVDGLRQAATRSSIAGSLGSGHCWPVESVLILLVPKKLPKNRQVAWV